MDTDLARIPTPGRDGVEIAAGSSGSSGVVRRVRSFAARWSKVDVLRKAAALSYYAVFSVVPILVIALWIGAQFVDAANLRTHVVSQVGIVLGPAARWLEEAIASAGDFRFGAAALVSFGLLLVGATTALAELESSLDEIFGLEARGDEGWVSLVRARAYALGLIVTLGFLLVVSLFVNGALAASLAWSGAYFGLSERWIALAASEASTFLSAAALFAAVYAWLPSRPIGRRAVVRATLVSATLFTVGRWFLATWLASSDIAESFGAAASLALVLLWFYYSAAIFYTAAILATESSTASRAKRD